MLMIKRIHKFLKKMKLKILMMLNLISKYLMIVQKIQFLKLKMIILVMNQTIQTPILMSSKSLR